MVKIVTDVTTATLRTCRSICSCTTTPDKMAEILLGGKKLGELKVTELKAELEKRGLQKKGVKSVLLTRLKNAILREALAQVRSNVQF